MDIYASIKKIQPTCKLKIINNDYNSIVWNSENTLSKPTLAECQAAWQEILNEEPLRLLREERGISYYTTANLQYSCSHGFFTIETGIENDKIIDTLSIITEIIKDLKQNLVTETELKFAKKLLNTQEELMLETQNDYASYLQRYLVYGKKIEKLGVRREKRNKITRQQIRNLCKKLFVNSNFLLVGLGPLKNSKKLKTAISLTI